MRNQDLFNELLQNQLKNVPLEKKLRYADIKRLCKYINTSIFDENVCSMWTGYITNANNITKGIYINFYFNGAKMALHRLLYVNFIGELSENEYLKFTCEHKGKCCNINHLKKFSYTKIKNNDNHNNKNEKINKDVDGNNKDVEDDKKNKTIKNKQNNTSFTVSFD